MKCSLEHLTPTPTGKTEEIKSPYLGTQTCKHFKCCPPAPPTPANRCKHHAGQCTVTRDPGNPLNEGKTFTLQQEGCKVALTGLSPDGEGGSWIRFASVLDWTTSDFESVATGTGPPDAATAKLAFAAATTKGPCPSRCVTKMTITLDSEDVLEADCRLTDESGTFVHHEDLPWAHPIVDLDFTVTSTQATKHAMKAVLDSQIAASGSMQDRLEIDFSSTKSNPIETSNSPISLDKETKAAGFKDPWADGTAHVCVEGLRWLGEELEKRSTACSKGCSLECRQLLDEAKNATHGTGQNLTFALDYAMVSAMHLPVVQCACLAAPPMMRSVGLTLLRVAHARRAIRYRTTSRSPPSSHLPGSLGCMQSSRARPTYSMVMACWSVSSTRSMVEPVYRMQAFATAPSFGCLERSPLQARGGLLLQAPRATTSARNCSKRSLA